METKAIFYNSYLPSPLLKSSLGWDKALIEAEIIYFRNYISDNKRSIEKRQAEFNKKVEKILYDTSLKYDSGKGYDEEGEELFPDFEDEYETKEFYNQVFFKSTFITLFSFFESKFKAICKQLERHTDCPIKLKDLSGKDIEQNKKYLELIFKVNLKTLNPVWQKLKDYQHIRNCIVHNNSDVKENESRKKDLKRIITTTDHLKYKDTHEDEFIIADINYLLDFCKDIQKFLKEVIEKVNKEVIESVIEGS